MKKLQPDIEAIVLPRFELGQIDSIEWGEWTAAEDNTLFVGVRINEEWHVLAENLKGKFPVSNDTIWLAKLLAEFHPKELTKLPFMPKLAIKAKKPVDEEMYKSDYIFRLEDKDSEFIDFMLFHA